MSGLSLIQGLADTPAPGFPPIVFSTEGVSALERRVNSARIARTEVIFDSPMPVVATRDLGTSSAPGVEPVSVRTGSPDLVGSGWLGQTLRGFRSWTSENGQHVCFDDGAAFAVSAGGDHVRVFNPPRDDALYEELVLGPALMLAFAQRQVFGLHASAVLGRAGAVVLLGPSGSGKSTLARHAVGEGALRLADDVVPFCVRAEGARVLPRFPQLKLTPALLVDDLDLAPAALVWVELRVGADLSLAQLAVGEATRCLVRDSVAARLFTPTALARHFEFCSLAASRLPAFRLTVPFTDGSQRAVVTASAYGMLRSLGLP